VYLCFLLCFNSVAWLDLGRNSITGVPSEIVSLTQLSVLSESILRCYIVATSPCMVHFTGPKVASTLDSVPGRSTATMIFLDEKQHARQTS
jgi:hypothetical protein